MKLQVEIFSTTLDKISAVLAGVAPSEYVSRVYEKAGTEEPISGALLKTHANTYLLAASVGEAWMSRDLEPFADWLGCTRRRDYWTVAMAWDRYNIALRGIPIGDTWIGMATHPNVPDRYMPFLDVSFGYLQWEFQLDLLYRICHDEALPARNFKKLWNTGHPHMELVARGLQLPDGRTLLEVLEAHSRPGVDKTVGSVPAYAASLLYAHLLDLIE